MPPPANRGPVPARLHAAWTHLKGGLLAWLLAAGALLGFGWTALQLRDARLADSLEQTRLFATTLEDSLTQSLRVIEITLSYLAEGNPMDTAESIATQELLMAIRNLPQVRSLSLADAQGRIVQSSNPGNIGARVRLGTVVPEGQPDVPQMRVGTPVQGRDWNDARPDATPDPDQPLFIPLIRPWVHHGQTHWVVVALNSDQFVNQAQSLFGRTPLQATWVRYDGSWLWSHDPLHTPDQQRTLARQVGDWLNETEAWSLEWLLAGDPRAHLLSYRTSSRYPLAVAVMWHKDAALQPWTERTREGLLVMLPLVVALAYAGGWMARRDRLLRLKQAELDEEHELATRVFESSSNAILVTEPDGSIVWVNPAFEALTGYRAEEVKGQNPRMLGSGVHPRAFFERVWTEVLATDRWRGMVTNRHRSGELYQADVTINAIRNAQGEVTHLAGVLRDVTEAQGLQARLKDSEERMALALEGGDLAYWDWDVASGQITANARWNRMLGLPETDPVTFNRWLTLLHADDAAAVQARLDAHLSGHTPRFDSEHRMRHADGHWVWILGSGRVTARGPQREALRMVGTHQDITDRKQAEEQMRLAASVFNHAQEAIMVTDPTGTLLDVNDAFLRITGYERHEVLGRNTSMLSSGRQDPAFYQAMWTALQQQHRWSGEIWNRRKSGEVYAELLTISAVESPDGRVDRYVALFSDITRLKEHEHKLERIAHFDALTGLPNRVLLSDRLMQALDHARRTGLSVAVVFLDLDGFKLINDTHGHAAGDRLLIQLAQRFKDALRSGDSAARLGGDEFVFVLQNLTDQQACLPVLERLRTAACSPVRMGDADLMVSASLGLAFYPQNEEVSPDQLLRQADQAMYQAKLSGKNRYHVFDAHHDRAIRSRHLHLDALRHALDAGQFELHYQPKVNMRTAEVVGMEALLRWNHPERGLLGPGAFLPDLEGQTLALDVGTWVLTRAVQQIAEWHAMGLDLPVSVNLDAQQLQDHGLVSRLAMLMQAHPGIRPGDLRLEVLETTALNDIQRVSEVMTACERLGVDFALDDFGTGYSSLTYLRRLPARELKIDQSFVRDMLDDTEDLAILQGVLGLARAFQREVIAEGVETVAHGRMLLRLGCERGQGYAIARPMPAGDVPAWHRTWRPDPSWLRLQRVPSDDLPVLFAVAEHRSWVRSLQAYLQGDKNTAPLLATHECEFGHWLLHLPTEHRFRQQAGFDDVLALHRQLHERGQQLVDSATARSRDGFSAAHPEWAVLENLSQRLVDRLMDWIDREPTRP